MIEEKLEIPTLGAEVNLYRPDRAAVYPGVVFLTDIWGVRPATIGQAKRLAEKGFAVLLPNAFHRYARNRTDGFDVPDQAQKNKAAGELFAALPPDKMAGDGKAYVDFLLAQSGVKAGKAGVVGHCYTGMMAVRIAAAMPDTIAAAASFHGGWLATDKPDSPHLLLPKIKARLYFGHADNDPLMPAESIERLEAALRAWRGAFQSEVYEGAAHGWTVPGRGGIYNELQAERAFEKEVELFDATLKD
jgi:carboxymethylenebutenolidase